jgi:hypothetical protein
MLLSFSVLPLSNVEQGNFVAAPGMKLILDLITEYPQVTIFGLKVATHPGDDPGANRWFL